MFRKKTLSKEKSEVLAPKNLFLFMGLVEIAILESGMDPVRKHRLHSGILLQC